MKTANSFIACTPAVPHGEIQGLKAAAAFLLVCAFSAHADMFQPAPTPGGIDARPAITSLVKGNTNATLSWHGPPGPYHVQMMPSLGPANWTDVANLTASAYSNSVTLSNLPADHAFFRLSLPPNSFVGSGGCAGCHGDKYNEWYYTGHASALATLKQIGMDQNPACIVCHTVGFGQPSGYTDRTNTPHLTDVGCENCHGPSAAHKYGEHDLVHPVVTLAAEVCGGCHDGEHHPTYSEWTTSGHAFVTPDVAGGSSGITNVANGPGRQMNCGPCHSGPTRLAMLANYEDAAFGRPHYLTLPDGQEAAAFGPTCAVCHDPHSNELDRQLRNPTFSTNFFTFFNGSATTNIYFTNWAGIITTNTQLANTVFATQYDPDIQICAQCHNSRGAIWQGNSRPPHHSPQYNLLIGALQTNYLNGTSITMISPHGTNAEGCVRCHMHQETPEPPTESNPANTGHSFEFAYESCAGAGCHNSSFQAQGFMFGMQLETSNNLARIVSLLNQWATNKGPALFTSNYPNYLQNAWEFSTRGTLSTVTNNGPTSADQALIPDLIKQARFGLYIVGYDQSQGVHNPPYTRFLLNDASNKVWQASR